jgi:hypothetical protein
MILRSITKHVKDQNWFAVCIDFFIVIVGVFIGIQVANWNEELAFKQRETELLLDLKTEVKTSIESTQQKIDSYSHVAAAAKRSLGFLSTERACDSNCWLVLVDFLHASQWQNVDVARSTYDSMRLIGLPKQRSIVEPIEAYLSQNKSAFDTYAELPYYRSLIRQLVPLQVQEFYWKHCWSITNGKENYNLDCPKGVNDELIIRTMAKITQHTEIEPHLTQWAGHIINLPLAQGSQIRSAAQAIEAIDAELEHR